MALDYNLLFHVANLAIIPFWILLIFLPYHRITQWISDRFIFQLILSLVYVFLLVEGLSKGSGGGFDSLEGIRKLFAGDAALLAGWVHYLVFDSFVGIWIIRDARHQGIPHLHLIVPLVFTFLAGPVGFMLYVFYRNIHQKKMKSRLAYKKDLSER